MFTASDHKAHLASGNEKSDTTGRMVAQKPTFNYLPPLSASITSVVDEGTLEDFVQRLDPRVTEATVSPLIPGRSGAEVLFVRRVADGDKLFPLVLKISKDPSDIRRERRNFEQFVKGILPNAPSLEGADEHLLAYTHAGILLTWPSTISDGYVAASAGSLTRLIERLVDVLVAWYVPSQLSHTNAEAMAFNPPLEDILSQLGGEFKQYAFLAGWWLDFQRDAPSSSTTRRNRVHGDLNVGNVIFDRTSADPIPFLIDFGSIREDSPFSDFAKLDRDIKTRLYFQDAKKAGRSFECMAAAVQEIDLNDRLLGADGANADGPEHKLAKCLHTVRSRLQKGEGRLYERTYFHSLLFSTLQILYRQDDNTVDTLKTQQQLACVSATALLSRLLQRTIPSSLVFRGSGGSVHIRIPEVDSGFSGIQRRHLRAGEVVETICNWLERRPVQDLRFVGATAHALLTDVSFLAALADRPERGPMTLHIYIMRSDTAALDQYCLRSIEPADVVRAKLAATKSALDTLCGSDVHKDLRVVLYEYDALPTLNIVQLDERFVFRPYRYGERADFVDMYSTDTDGGQDIDHILGDVIRDLTYRSMIKTLKWTSTPDSPWPR